MIRRIASIVAVSTMSGCSLVTGAANGDAARAAISSMLTDPESAQFKDLEATGPCMTGFVNARNRMGGYVGFQPFYYRTDTGEAGLSPAAMPYTGLADFEIEQSQANIAYMNGEAKCRTAAIRALHDEHPELLNAS